MAKQEVILIIKQNEQFQLNATLTPCGNQHSLAFSQFWPKAQNPHHRHILQVLLTNEELEIFSRFLARKVSA
jgi:hypothetical protein